MAYSFWKPEKFNSRSGKSTTSRIYDFDVKRSKSSSKKSSKHYNTWDSWKSYYSFWGESKEDDNESLIVRTEGFNYEIPSIKDIKSKVRSARNTDTVNFIKELAVVCYLKMIGEKNWEKEEIDPDSQSDVYKLKKSLYDSVYDEFIPGFTPLEQAVNIFYKVGDITDENEYIENGDVEKSESVDFNLQFDRSVYWDPTINEQLELNKLSKQKKAEILNKISIIGNLGSEFKVEKEVEEKIVANSDVYSNKIMRDYSQLQMVNMYQKMLPTFRTKLLTKDLIVNVPVDRTERKQKIIIILDFSGSMSEDFKQTWVNALLIDRFRYVIKGEAEVFFSYFVCDSDDLNFTHVKDKQDVIDFWSRFSNCPNGGTTAVGRMVNRIKSEIEEKRLMNLDIDLSEELPEILVINDGQDPMDVDSFPYKTNAVCLEEFNEDLKNLCIKTHGKKVYIDYDDNIVCHSESGIEKIN